MATPQQWLKETIKKLENDPNTEIVTNTLGLKILMLKTGGRFAIFNEIYNERYEIKKKSLGAGVYRIWLEKEK